MISFPYVGLGLVPTVIIIDLGTWRSITEQLFKHK
jgi:hypothetical protein